MSILTRTALTRAVIALLPSVVLGIGCGDDPVTPPPAKNPAKILMFDANPRSVAPGGMTTISWRVQDATSVTISSAAGVLVDKSPQASGTQMTGAITAATVFTILAVGEGGNAMGSVMVDVTAMPSDPEILTFTPSVMTVKPNDPVTLTWTTRNTTAITLGIPGGATIINRSGTRLNDSETVSPTQTTTYRLTAEGAMGTMQKTQEVTIQVEGTPVVTSFTGMPQAIELGGMATLSWEVSDAAMITISDGSATPVYSGTMLMSSIQVSPTTNTTYTLHAVSTLGQDVASTPVMITVNRAARIDSFTSNPAAIQYGDTSELRWSVSRAPGGVVIRTAGGAAVTTSSATMGAFTVTPTVTTSYVLTARNTDGDSTAMATVTVSQVVPRILRFDAAPNPAHIGDQSTITWSTLGATTVRVIDATGTSVYSGNGADGTVAVTVTATLARYTLETSNPNGGNTQTLDLEGQRDPIIDTLAVRPAIFIQTATTATVTWSTTDALRTTLTINGVAAPGFSGTATGSYVFTTTTTARLVLTALNDVAQTSREIAVFRFADATVETGNDAASAIPLGNAPGAIGVIGPTGGPAPNGDLDYFTVVVPNGGSLFIETTDGRGGCPFDTLITLFGPNGTTVLGTDDDDGTGACSLIDPARDAFASNLAAGTYYVQVRGFGATTVGRYVLTVLANPARCGNSLFENRAGEQCDDGNTTASDGCSATCQAEPLVTIMGPGANQTLGGALTPAGNADYVRIDMLAQGYIAADVFIPSRGRCDATGTNSADTVLTLFDANFNVLGSDDNDGINSCSRIDPTFDAFALVPAGTYYLRVTEFGNDGTVPAYLMDVRTIGQGCGNTLLEGAEECDDGNAAPGDGCSDVCVFEGLREVEPNNSFATGTVIVTATTSFIVRGTISPIADNDYYLIDVPAGYHIDAYITVNSLDQCPDDPEGQVGLYNPAGTLQGTLNNTGGPQGNCGRVWPYTVTQSRGVAAGRWGIRVNETGDNGALGVYFLHVNLIAPLCSNRIIEGTEQCEDGNRANGDGCDAFCRYEPVATVDLSALGTSTIAGVITPEFNRDAIRVNVTGTANVLLRAETFVNAAGRSCPVGTTTRLRLFNATTNVELGTDAIDGINSCSLINPQTDTFASLAPGSYWLVVEEDGNNATIPTYEVVVRGIATNVCGNGVIEPGNMEQCDGQSFCNPTTCQITPAGTITGPTATQVFSDAISVAGELDFYRVTVTAAAYVTFETGAPTIGVCATADTLVRLFNATTGAEVVSDDDDGAGNCSLYPSATDVPTLVQPGTYFVRVEEFNNDGTIAAYQVRVGVVAANVCGNGVRENAEACDDGNTTAGDGCSATCLVEPQGTHVGPGTPPSTFTQAISVIGEVDRFQIDVTATSYLRAETFAPTAGVCNGGVDTVIRLRNAAGTEVGSDDEDGINSCSLITGADAFARLAPGTYILSVEDYLNDGTIGAYALTIGLTPVDVCGNGVLESARGEQCDDGNTVAGDGCSATCLNEPDGTVNGPTGGVVSFPAAIEAINDNDIFQINLTVPSMVRIDVSDPASATCAVATFTPQITLISANGSTIETDTVDGPGSCSLIGMRVLRAGTYTVRVNENGNDAVLAAYAINIQTTALTASVDGTYVGGAAQQIFTDALDTLGDADVFAVTLAAPGRIVAETGTPIGACAVATTVLRVYNTAGDELMFDTTDGVNSCSLIDAADRLDLPADTYYVVVEESGRNATLASYELRLVSTVLGAPTCGDSYRDLGEQCDDGNATAGDGCTACVQDDATFVQEINTNNGFSVAQNLGVLPVNSSVNVSATMREGSADWFQFTLAGPANVRINTYGAPGQILTSCPVAVGTVAAADTVMALMSGELGDYLATGVSAAQPTMIEYDDDDGFAACSIISGTDTAPTRRALTAGTYWLEVRRFSNNTQIGQYYLNIDVAP